MRAWIFQDPRQKQKHGSKAPWSVGWYTPDGNRRSKRVGSKSQAEKLRRKREGELAAGTYQTESRESWKDFRTEYQAKVGSRKSLGDANSRAGGAGALRASHRTAAGGRGQDPGD